MRVVLEVDDAEIAEAVADANDDKRQSGDVNKITVKMVKARLRDQEWLVASASALLGSTIEDLW